MTLVQTQPHPTHPAPAHPTAADAMDAAGPQVSDDMTVEVALSVMAGARTGHLLVRDDDLRVGLVTRAQLTTVRDSPACTDRLQPRDLSRDGGPLTLAAALPTGRAVRPRRVVTPSVVGVVGEQDGTPGVPALVLA
ncbi:CBS domain-containing protein [Streptomyces sp. SP18CS02]|uniref:CBS domain-containing protein n=1 Tax=Streptomyces sp. SP18CS02 TaxID=3002531 RepID=UPI002E775D27|nr:CBS domain-containing protein [Streptomyces sp. SP18CS02]MEE1751238.1 CBS domain-containing protein [Streptomyces sp. SP18CS02]